MITKTYEERYKQRKRMAWKGGLSATMQRHVHGLIERLAVHGSVQVRQTCIGFGFFLCRRLVRLFLCLSHDSPVPFLFFQTFFSILCEAEAKSGFKTLPWPRGEKTTLDVWVLFWRRVLLAATGSSNVGGSLRRVLILRYVLGVELEVFWNKEGSPWGIGRILLWKGVLAGLL